ncbi:tRNA(fMet)-specific endonuclease VapC [Pirellulimonas nuda]|uniref:Ribonuclease VapC n=1 Tax=Pirellulimonas nuda TaxID=2528009 RepID=A0A518D7T6_9BACT|nr:type II toxin-antitoxin system VapC family toxin [Pirellulimonas nuda]QDU87526.1 tRNA(fMet)-specific endonuclease VapC [Pirellulimonas nuda]
MNRLVIDASVLVKLFIEEVGSRSAALTVRKADALFAPDLLWPETGNILWKYCRRGELEAHEADAVLDEMLRMPIEIVEGQRLIRAAVKIATATDRTAYDCLYVAAAIEVDATLVTADERLCHALEGSPFAERVRPIGKK